MFSVWKSFALTLAGIALGLLVLALARPVDATPLDGWQVRPPIVGKITPAPTAVKRPAAAQKTCQDVRELVKRFESTNSTATVLWTGPRSAVLWYGVHLKKSVRIVQTSDCTVRAWLYAQAHFEAMRAKYGRGT